MSEIAIRIWNLSKQYRIGQHERYKTFRETLTNAICAPIRFAASTFKYQESTVGSHPSNNTIWALKNVSFEVKQAEVVGIIGRNGVGKSTLLKILSRITEPTSGQAEMYGRVGALLEVGTGFHPELTGRENIYLNGAILGMKKNEIDRKLDEIIAFAETEKFIDTPVKHYSSGMQVRLAFAVAAHLEPEILLVDEVLAVGDTRFQEKCMGAMQKSATSGKTILFVSHNMASIQHLCTKAILLKEGALVAIGQPSEVIGYYLSEAKEESIVFIDDWKDRITTGEGRLIQFEIADGSGKATTHIPVGGSVRFTFHATLREAITDPMFGVIVSNAVGEPLLDLKSIHSNFQLGRVKDNIVVQAFIPKIGLYPGRYLLSPWITDSACRRNVDFVKFCCSLHVDPAPGPYGDLKLDPLWGKYWIESGWSVV